MYVHQKRDALIRDLLSAKSLICRRVELQTLQRWNFLGKSAHTRTQSDFKRSWHQGRREEEGFNEYTHVLLIDLAEDKKLGKDPVGAPQSSLGIWVAAVTWICVLLKLFKLFVSCGKKTGYPRLCCWVKLKSLPVQFPRMHLIVTISPLVYIQELQFLTGLFSCG